MPQPIALFAKEFTENNRADVRPLPRKASAYPHQPVAIIRQASAVVDMPVMPYRPQIRHANNLRMRRDCREKVIAIERHIGVGLHAIRLAMRFTSAIRQPPIYCV